MAHEMAQDIVNLAAAAQFGNVQFELELNITFKKGGMILFEGADVEIEQPAITLFRYDGLDKAVRIRMSTPGYDLFSRGTTTFRLTPRTVNAISTHLSNLFSLLNKVGREILGPDYGVPDEDGPMVLELTLGIRNNGDLFGVSHQEMPYADGMDFNPYLTFILQLLQAADEIAFVPDAA